MEAQPHRNWLCGIRISSAAWCAFFLWIYTARAHDTLERLAQIRVPALVVAGEVDLCTPPRLGRAVADQIPDAEFVVLAGEAHQPFQEQRDDFNALVDEFWSRVEAVGSSS